MRNKEEEITYRQFYKTKLLSGEWGLTDNVKRFLRPLSFRPISYSQLLKISNLSKSKFDIKIKDLMDSGILYDIRAYSEIYYGISPMYKIAYFSNVEEFEAFHVTFSAHKEEVELLFHRSCNHMLVTMPLERFRYSFEHYRDLFYPVKSKKKNEMKK